MNDRHDVSALWQRETRNLIEDCAAEADALAAVRQMVEESGASALEVVLLAGSRDDDTRMRTVAAGLDRVGIAQRVRYRLPGYVGNLIVARECARRPPVVRSRHEGGMDGEENLIIGGTVARVLTGREPIRISLAAARRSCQAAYSSCFRSRDPKPQRLINHLAPVRRRMFRHKPIHRVEQRRIDGRAQLRAAAPPCFPAVHDRDCFVP